MSTFVTLIAPEELARRSPHPPDSSNLGTYHIRWLSTRSCRLRERYPWGCWPIVFLMLLYGGVLVYGAVLQIRKGNLDNSERPLLYGTLLLLASTPMFIRKRIWIDGELGEVRQTRLLVGRKRTPFADIRRIDLHVVELNKQAGCRLHVDPPSHEFLHNTVSASLAGDTGENIVSFAVWLAVTLSCPLYLVVTTKYDGSTKAGQQLNSLRKLGQKEWN